MRTFDIAIAGGGPAGAVAALLLARTGARVALVDAGAARPRIEGLSPRVMQVLASLGLAADGAGPAVLRRTAWGTGTQAENREHPVERAAFDAGLRRQAEAAGAVLVAARAARLAPGRLATGAGEIRAGLVVEARGRAAPAGRSRLRGPATVAIAGRAGADAMRGASITALPEGWVWRIGVPGFGDWVQVVRDPAGMAPGAAGLAAAWRNMTGLAPEGLAARAAELRLTAPELDPALPRIGDAAVAMDPLSGHGVFWALSSALAAPPLLTALLDGAADLACAFHRERVAAAFWRQARIGRDFHRLAAPEGAFWAARAAWPDDAPAHGHAAAPALRRQVVVRAGRLAEAEALVTPRDPDGVAFVAGREIAPVLRRLGGGRLPARAEFCARILPEVPPAEAGLIHDWLTDRGVDRLPPTAPGATSERDVPARKGMEFTA